MIVRDFEVLSSDGHSKYQVTFTWKEPNLTVVCTCPAGVLGKMCRHKESLMNGDASALFDPKECSQLSDTMQWIRASAISEAIENCKSAQIDFENAQKTLKQAKRDLEILIASR